MVALQPQSNFRLPTWVGTHTIGRIISWQVDQLSTLCGEEYVFTSAGKGLLFSFGRWLKAVELKHGALPQRNIKCNLLAVSQSKEDDPPGNITYSSIYSRFGGS